MRNFLHDWWPVAAVALFTLFLVVQIPRKVIFPPTSPEDEVEPFASFVALDDGAYAAAIQSGRMSWQVRARAQFSGVESRTSSPVRIRRSPETLMSVDGLYPCGEGAGYAGGITSAAMDGIKIAEAICKKYHLMLI